MLPDIERTIVALASGAQAAPRAIVRLSGPDTRGVLTRVCGWNAGKTATFEESEFLSGAEPQVARVMCPLPSIARSIPVTILFWPDSRSYTGQPSAELHLIGSMPLVEAVIARCTQCGAQPAERGEFTLRAFLSGKLDLAQAEAVLGVIEANSHQSLKSALSQLGGNLAPEVAPLRDRIVDVVAELEAGLDFVDEDIEFITTEELVVQLESVQSALERFRLRLNTRSTTQHLPCVILAGLPNSGKSSLFNALAGQQLAIVADVAGTTRDYLERRMTFACHPTDGVRSNTACDAMLIDTAGWESLVGDDPRALAQQQLVQCLRQADVGLICIDMSQPGQSADEVVTAFERLVKQVQTARSMHWIFVATKIDAAVEPDWIDWSDLSERVHASCQAAGWPAIVTRQPVPTSSYTDQGIELLRSTLATHLLSLGEAEAANKESAGPLEIVHHTAVRCRAALTAALTGIESALNYARSRGGEEFVAAELRLVLGELASIIGEVHSDDILGEIFSRFCIGK